MSKFTEDTLNNWRKPPSDSEETKLLNVEKAIRQAINDDDKLSKFSITVFGQGSYANDTNVRLNSDIDINVCYTSGFFFDLPEGTDRKDFGLNEPIAYTYDEYKNDVETALVNKFGRSDVVRKNKCIFVKGNTYRSHADVVPTWNYHRYRKDGSYIEGVKYFSDTNDIIDNYPIQHIENGKVKNKNTQKRFKRLTRIVKRIRFKMIDDGKLNDDSISSFLLESLVWNIPDIILNAYDTWTERLKECLRYLYHKTKNNDDCKEWGEVSELLYLFHSGRKWERSTVNQFILDMWKYLEF